MPVKIAPSLLSADFARLAEEVAMVERGGADWIHVDVMDGHFVPNLTFGPALVKAVRRVTRLPLDVHLMIEHPGDFVEPFAKAGADYLTVHVEAADDPLAVIRHIRELGVRPGVSVNPPTPLEAAEPYLSEVDLVLVMSVNPGFGGQGFIADVLPKVRSLAGRPHGFAVEIDGGINAETVARAAAAGAEVLVAGSAIFGAADPLAAMAQIRERADAARTAS
ncbi:MAG TPA: ribulose-phosphate 3-epimerase [Bacillota bacterium]|jgi:ribulose-phosphate 3-epimerase